MVIHLQALMRHYLRASSYKEMTVIREPPKNVGAGISDILLIFINTPLPLPGSRSILLSLFQKLRN